MREEEAGSDLTGLAQLGFWDGGKVGDISEDVEDCDDYEGEEAVAAELFDGVL